MNAIPTAAVAQVGFPISDTTDFTWNESGYIYHYLLTIEKYIPDVHGRGLPENSYVFKAIDQKPSSGPRPKANTLAEMKKYARELFTLEPLMDRMRQPPTPYDVKVSNQAWVLFELDEYTNWQFSSSTPACSTKVEDPIYIGPDGNRKYGFNVSLHHTYANGAVEDPYQQVPRPGCRAIFFGIVHRGPYEGQGFNLFVEFMQDIVSGSATHVLPIVIDPDVGNDGPNEFPPP